MLLRKIKVTEDREFFPHEFSHALTTGNLPTLAWTQGDR